MRLALADRLDGRDAFFFEEAGDRLVLAFEEAFFLRLAAFLARLFEAPGLLVPEREEVFFALRLAIRGPCSDRYTGDPACHY